MKQNKQKEILQRFLTYEKLLAFNLTVHVTFFNEKNLGKGISFFIGKNKPW